MNARVLSSALLIAVLAAAMPAQDPAAAAHAQPTQGLKVTFAPLDEKQKQKEPPHTQVLRLLSLHVEKGDSPTSFLSPGLFQARFEGSIDLPLRDRARFRAFGKGDIKLSVNGEPVLSGTLRSNKALESQEVKLKKGQNDVVCVLDSAAFGDATLRVHWSTADFGWEPIAPERWHCNTDDAELRKGEQLRLGQELFIDRRCARCHLTHNRPLGESAYGELDWSGPDLRSVGSRVRHDFLVDWINDPHAVRPEAAMPKVRLEGASPADVAAFLAAQSAAPPEPTFTAEQAAAGETRFHDLGCIACHLSPHEHPAKSSLGDRIALHFVPKKWFGQALIDFLRDPRANYPHIRMPDFRLSAEDATAIAAFLLRGRGPGEKAPAGDAEKGRKAIQKAGCMRCHQLVGEDLFRCIELDQLQQQRKPDGCITGGKANLPDFHLADAEKQALTAFLPRSMQAIYRRAPTDFVARALRWHRCTSCHGMDGHPSVWAQVVADASEPPPPEQDPVAQGLPALTWVGAKLQPSWMEKFVTGKGTSPRPWLKMRMPSFAEHGAAIVQGLAREHGYVQDEADENVDMVLAQAGQQLVKMGEGFGCVQCHGIGDQPAVQVFERQGINFRFTAQRVRKEYYTRWLGDPTRIDPDSRMPKFADPKGKTAFTDVLGGDAQKQFEAIWHFIHTVR